MSEKWLQMKELGNAQFKNKNYRKLENNSSFYMTLKINKLKWVKIIEYFFLNNSIMEIINHLLYLFYEFYSV